MTENPHTYIENNPLEDARRHRDRAQFAYAETGDLDESSELIAQAFSLTSDARHMGIFNHEALLRSEAGHSHILSRLQYKEALLTQNSDLEVVALTYIRHSLDAFWLARTLSDSRKRDQTEAHAWGTAAMIEATSGSRAKSLELVLKVGATALFDEDSRVFTHTNEELSPSAKVKGRIKRIGIFIASGLTLGTSVLSREKAKSIPRRLLVSDAEAVARVVEIKKPH